METAFVIWISWKKTILPRAYRTERPIQFLKAYLFWKLEVWTLNNEKLKLSYFRFITWKVKHFKSVFVFWLIRAYISWKSKIQYLKILEYLHLSFIKWPSIQYKFGVYLVLWNHNNGVRLLTWQWSRRWSLTPSKEGHWKGWLFKECCIKVY